MPRDFFDPSPEQQNIVLIDSPTLQKAQRMIAACEACSEDAEIPFDNILDCVTGSDPSVTDENAGASVMRDDFHAAPASH
jgi:hypothetical protein